MVIEMYGKVSMGAVFYDVNWLKTIFCINRFSSQRWLFSTKRFAGYCFFRLIVVADRK